MEIRNTGSKTDCSYVIYLLFESLEILMRMRKIMKEIHVSFDYYREFDLNASYKGSHNRVLTQGD